MSGYSQSGIPVTVAVHCIEQTKIKERPKSLQMLWKFESMKGTTEALRKSADAATLLVTRFDDACGIGYLGEYSTGDTLSALAKSCAVGYYTFGHELGHNFGCDHDEDVRMRNIFFLYKFYCFNISD